MLENEIFAVQDFPQVVLRWDTLLYLLFRMKTANVNQAVQE